MILFKACPRCGGDVDATDKTDIFCVQCAHRPAVVSLQVGAQDGGGFVGVTGLEALCPRCDSDETIALEKLRARDNTCYRCRKCGHIFSPRTPAGAGSMAS